MALHDNPPAQPLSAAHAVSRRSFIQGAAACTLAHARAYAARLHSGLTLVYVGTDTKFVDGTAWGKGIYLFEVDEVSGDLRQLRLAAETTSPSWLTLHPSSQFLYSVNEVRDYEGSSGSVTSFAIDRGTGDLRRINTVSSHGAGPAHMSIDRSGRYAFVANYFGGSIAVLPIQPDGSLAPAVFVHRDEGSLGALHAASAPPGSFAISGHDAPHAHMILADPANRFVLQTDLGQDRIYVYRFDAATGQLAPAQTPYVTLPPGDGPRHIAFHPNRRWMYSIQEEASTLVFFQYDSAAGALLPQQTISTLPQGFTGSNFCSELLISSDGRFLYAANRLHNSIAVFAIAADGKLRFLADTWTEGDYPSNMNIEPDGRFLYVSNQRSDSITSFRINPRTGLLTFTGRYAPLGTPMSMVFLR